MAELPEHSHYSRRQLLQHLAAATIATSSLSNLTALAAIRPRRVIIIGSGLAGLCAAYELERRGYTVILLEAEKTHLGGRVRTERFAGGLSGELGAMRIPASHDLTRRYIRQFGLELRPFVQFNPEAYYYADGQRQRIKNVAHLNRHYTLGMEAREGSIWMEQFSEIVGGMDRLPAAFATHLRAKPRLGCAVTRIEQNASRRRAAVVYRESGPGGKTAEHRIEADFVLCTIPLPVLRRLEIYPAFSSAKQRAIRGMPYLAADKVLAVTARRFWETDDGIYGGGTFTDLPSGITYYPSDNARKKDPRVSSAPGVLLASYTIGRAAKRLAELAPAARSARVLHDLAHVHPQLAYAGMVKQTVSWSWDQHQWTGGGFAAPGSGEALRRELIRPEGRIFFAGEHTSQVHTWMQGALESGLRAVRETLAAAVQ